MSLSLVKINGGGSVNEEYVLLLATSDCNLKGWVIADSTFDAKGNASNKTRHTYWFRDKLIKSGEYIAVFTKAGTATEGKMDSGAACHLFYWNLGTAVWNNDGDTAVLLKSHATQRRKSS